MQQPSAMAWLSFRIRRGPAKHSEREATGVGAHGTEKGANVLRNVRDFSSAVALTRGSSGPLGRCVRLAARRSAPKS